MKKLLLNLDEECVKILEDKKEETGATWAVIIRRAIKKI